jgi:hypothetical protein
VPIILKSGSLELLESSGPYTGIVYLYLYCPSTPNEMEQRYAATLYSKPAIDGWSTKHPCRFERDPVRTVQEPEWALGLVWTDAEYLATTCIRFPDRPTHSELQ